MDYIAIVALELNGNSYASGDTIAPEDVPTTKLRSMVDKGLIDAVGGGSDYTPTGGITARSYAFTTTELNDDEVAVDVLAMEQHMAVSRIVTDVPARVRMYASEAARDADELRAIGVSPADDHGLAVEVVTTVGDLDLNISPAAFLVADAQDVALAVTNLSGGSSTVEVTFYVMTFVDTNPVP